MGDYCELPEVRYECTNCNQTYEYEDEAQRCCASISYESVFICDHCEARYTAESSDDEDAADRAFACCARVAQNYYYRCMECDCEWGTASEAGTCCGGEVNELPHPDAMEHQIVALPTIEQELAATKNEEWENELA